MTSLAIEELATLDDADIARVIASLSDNQAFDTDDDFPNWSHDGQKAPPGDWKRWVIMGGRGFGKTRAGAEWVAAQARGNGTLRIALVAATQFDARRIMVEGESGLLAIAGDEISDWLPTQQLLRFESGAEAALFSGASPDALRGFQHHIAWCDELAKWRYAQETWNMLQLGLRLGERPRAVITTTPATVDALETILDLVGTVISRGRTRENLYLSEDFKETVHLMYRGTRLEKQELEGELLPDSRFALWTAELLEARRINPPHSWGGFTKLYIGVDPPIEDGTCGIVACAMTQERDAPNIGHVLADHSVTGRSPEGWARAVADAVRAHEAATGLAVKVIAERNQGGRMVEANLRAADANLRVKLVHAREGKIARAGPIAHLFEAGRVKLAGHFPELEAELRQFKAGVTPTHRRWHGPDGRVASPDRADAMVWALTELMLGEQRAEPRVRRL